MDITLRRAIESDARALAELGRRTFEETFAPDNTPEDMHDYVSKTYGEAHQLKEIRDPTRRIEIAWLGDSAIGYLHLRIGEIDPSVKTERPIELLRIYVDSNWHGKGVAGKLMQRSLEIASCEGFKSIWLGVWEHNLRAQKFYRKFGFEIVGNHIFRLGKSEQNDAIMSLSLV